MELNFEFINVLKEIFQLKYNKNIDMIAVSNYASIDFGNKEVRPLYCECPNNNDSVYFNLNNNFEEHLRQKILAKISLPRGMELYNETKGTRGVKYAM